MKGYYMCSLEGEEARIAYENLSHSYTSENYGEKIAKHLIKKNGNTAEPNLENIIGKVIWKNGELVLVYDQYEGYFSLYKLPGLKTESLKHRNTIKLTESRLKRIISESVKKVLNEEQEWDGMLSGGEVLDKNIKNGNTTGDIRLMCEFLQKYVIPNGEEQDGKFIYREHAVDVTEINRSIYEAMRYLYKIVKQFGY